MRVKQEPGETHWERAVPLDLEVWMGNVNLRPEIVALDQETSHRSTAQCHHGPENSQPVKVRLQAWYTDRELYLRIRWPDATEDRDLGRWERRNGGWTARPGADDGIAILWGKAQPVADPDRVYNDGGGNGRDGFREEFRCQKTCHMMEVDVYDGGTQMRMGMRYDGDTALDLWRWRAGVTDPFGLADDMVVDGQGKRGDRDMELMQQLPKPVGDPGERVAAPYRETRRPTGRQAQVRTRSVWADGWWEVLFVRELSSSDPDDITFTPGMVVPFSISVFDSTFTEHHVLDLGARLFLADRTSNAGAMRNEDRRNRYEPLDF
jgi:hypothetical protein